VQARFGETVVRVAGKRFITDEMIISGATVEALLLNEPAVVEADVAKVVAAVVAPVAVALDIGVAGVDGEMVVLLQKGTSVPATATHEFGRAGDADTAVIDVYEGARAAVKDNTKVATVALSGLPAVTGVASVFITVAVDAAGVVTVTGNGHGKVTAKDVVVVADAGKARASNADSAKAVAAAVAAKDADATFRKDVVDKRAAAVMAAEAAALALTVDDVDGDEMGGDLD
jgi:molecular chaperone DnaK (HSP70)